METVSSIVDLLHSPASSDGVEPLLPLAKAPVQEPRLAEPAPAAERRGILQYFSVLLGANDQSECLSERSDPI